jgi:sensor domain CHASE-containing protein
MEEGRKKRLTNILFWTLFATCFIIVVITSIVLNYKQQEYDRLKEENERIEKIIDEDETEDQNLTIIVG